jgi:asparaginyl-tRNA synthetase
MASGMRIASSKSWTRGNEHYLAAVEDPWYVKLCEIQDAISVATLGFFRSRGLWTLHLPITTASISSPLGLGSDSEPVAVDLFGVRTYLADSMQFMLEYGCRLHRFGCWYLMPSFRGEPADTTHLCQFYHAESEIPGSIDDVMQLVEEYLRVISTELYERCGESIRQLAGGLDHLEALIASTGPLPRLTLDEAVALLGDDRALVVTSSAGFCALTREGEQALIERFGGFVWVTEQDHLAVPFYQAFAGSHRKAKAADLLFGLGEVVGAGERHCTPKQLQQALALHGVDPEPYIWYIRLRERYPLQTAGFGLGTERYICWLLNHDDVRDCQLLPRFNGERTIP